MTDERFLTPPGWPQGNGYAHGMSTRGRIVFVAGQVGWNPATGKFETDDLVEQIAQALQNVLEVLRAGVAEPGHIARMTWYITDKQDYLNAQAKIGQAYRNAMGKHFPAMSVIEVKGLMEPRAKVEIEVTAVVPE
jgi:enamine deaminase RidA (YjgF/YER057c/UK114 family)